MSMQPEEKTIELPSDSEFGNINSSSKEAEPIFVRIDKFQDSQKKFESIKKDVKDIEKVLGKVKEQKEKEENEIREWTEDLEKIKARLSEIDSNIFDQV